MKESEKIMKRMLTDEELEARIDAMNEREAQNIQIDKSVVVITVHGRIGNVRWLEEYGAQKRKGLKYFEYSLEVASADAPSILHRLQSTDGVWFEDQYKVTEKR